MSRCVLKDVGIDVVSELCRYFCAGEGVHFLVTCCLKLRVLDAVSTSRSRSMWKVMSSSVACVKHKLRVLAAVRSLAQRQAHLDIVS